MLRTCRTRASREGFVFAVARNLLYEHYRKSPGAIPVDPEHVSLVDLAPSPSAIVYWRQEDELLALALRRIPIESQLALELFYGKS